MKSKHQWTITTLDPAPAMTRSNRIFNGTFDDAILIANKLWENNHDSSPCVHYKTDTTYFYYSINADGSWSNRNEVPNTSGNMKTHDRIESDFNLGFSLIQHCNKRQANTAESLAPLVERAGNSIEWFKCNCGAESNLMWKFCTFTHVLGCSKDCAIKVIQGQQKLNYYPVISDLPIV
jgi:hypothetical protein